MGLAHRKESTQKAPQKITYSNPNTRGGYRRPRTPGASAALDRPAAQKPGPPFCPRAERENKRAGLLLALKDRGPVPLGARTRPAAL